jgi:WD40 repeat protein
LETGHEDSVNDVDCLSFPGGIGLLAATVSTDSTLRIWRKRPDGKGFSCRIANKFVDGFVWYMLENDYNYRV